MKKKDFLEQKQEDKQIIKYLLKVPGNSALCGTSTSIIYLGRNEKGRIYTTDPNFSGKVRIK